MGKGITYCCRCGLRLVEDDFSRQKAFTIGPRDFCLKCKEALPPEEQARAETPPPVAAPTPTPPTGVKSPSGRYLAVAAKPGSERYTKRAAAPRSSNAVLIAVAAGTTVLALALIAVLVDSGSSSAPRSTRPSTPPEPALASEPPRLTPTEKPPPRPDREPAPATEEEQQKARRLYEELKQFAQANKHSDLERVVARYRELAFDFERTGLYEDFKRDLEELTHLLRSRYDAEFKIVHDEVLKLADEQKFALALSTLAEARKKHNDREWLSRFEPRERDIRDRACRFVLERADRVKTCLENNAFDAARAEVERIRALNMPEFSEQVKELLQQIERAQASVQKPPPEPPPRPADPPPGPADPPPAQVKPDPARDRKARELLDKADKLWKDPAKRLEAAKVYKQLHDEFGETELVKKNAKTVGERAAYGLDNVLRAADLRAEGLWDFRKVPDWTEKVFQMKQDAPERGRGGHQSNFVEATVAVREGLRYATWVFVGFCCQENDSLYVQFEDGVDHEGRARGLIRSNEFMLIQPRTHATHNCNRSITSWGWLYAGEREYKTAGLKKIRLYSDNGGTAIGMVIHSAQQYRNAPPPDPRK